MDNFATVKLFQLGSNVFFLDQYISMPTDFDVEKESIEKAAAHFAKQIGVQQIEDLYVRIKDNEFHISYIEMRLMNLEEGVNIDACLIRGPEYDAVIDYMHG